MFSEFNKVKMFWVSREALGITLKGSSVGSYLWESCGKVFLLGSGLQTGIYTKWETETEKQKKKKKQVRTWENMWYISFFCGTFRSTKVYQRQTCLRDKQFLIGSFESQRAGPESCQSCIKPPNQVIIFLQSDQISASKNNCNVHFLDFILYEWY